MAARKILRRGLRHAGAITLLAAVASCSPGPTTPDHATTPTRQQEPRAFIALAAGFVHTCALDREGRAFCWGNNDYDQLGTETSERCGGRPCSTDPLAVRGSLTFTALAAGWVHNCGITEDGRAWCWGGGSVERQGYLGDGSLRRSLDPVAVVSDSAFASLTLGDGHTCALTRSGSAYCWGENDSGQLGDGSRVDRGTPVAVAGSLRFRELSAGAYHTCGITLDGAAYCWGENRWGQLGIGDVPYNNMESGRDLASAVDMATTWAHIAAGWQHTCAITASGVTYCWGRNDIARQLGDDSDATHRGIPGPIVADQSFTALTAGPLATCGRTAGNETWCWGANYYGGLGDGSVAAQGVGRPARVQGGPFVDITLGQAHSCALGDDRALWCWGDNSAGQY
jgi:alpha-tubulin suppressor-like RCC1 family protein